MKFLKKLVSNIQHRFFQLKRRIYGEYYWVGPEVEIGVCDECASLLKVPYEQQAKIPTRRLIKEDNLYLCKNHWEKLRASTDPDIRMDMEPFLRLEK